MLQKKEGIRIEGCLTAAEIFSVDPKLFYNEIHGINNAWISISGYQAQEFSIIPSIEAGQGIRDDSPLGYAFSAARPRTFPMLAVNVQTV